LTSSARWATASKESVYDKGDFASLERFIVREIIQGGRIVSLRELEGIYGLNCDDRRYSYYLKQLIGSKFHEKLVFLSPNIFKGSDFVASMETVRGTSHIRKQTIEKAASYIREDIISFMDQLPDLQWPPTMEQLASEERKPPQSVRIFLQKLLKSPNQRNDNETVSRLIESLSQDFIHGVTMGRTLTEKHFLMSLVIHNLTGQKNAVELLNKFGHGMSYSLMSDILTANAESAIAKSKISTLLPLAPATPDEVVLTHFWVDNFDLLTDTQYGDGSINITNLMAFQEGRIEKSRSFHIPVPRKATRQLSNEEPQVVIKKFDPHVQPPSQRFI